MSPKQPRDRRVPPIWFIVLLLIPAATIVWLRVGDRTGDSGMTNVFSTMLGLVFLLMATVWFLFFSGFTRKLRFLSLLGAVGLVVAFGLLFRYDGVDGSMVPSFAFRFAASDEIAAAPAARDGAVVDLVTTTDDDFPGFLGRRRDGAVEHVRLARSWGSSEPELVWRQPIGPGWSGFAVVNGHAVTLEQRGDDEAVTAYNVHTGALEWSHSHPGRFGHVLGGIGPRSTPAIDEGRVYTLGAAGWLACLDGATGDVVWEKDLLAEFDISPEEESASIAFGRSNSPLVHGDLLITSAGGKKGGHLVSLIAYDKRTGDKVWEGGGTQVSFASPLFARLGGVDQFVVVNESTLSGHDIMSGRVLWEHPWPGLNPANSSSSQAVPVPPDRVFVSKGYGGGSALLRLEPGADGTFDTHEVWRQSRLLRTKFTNVVIHGGFVYGLSDGILECVNLETGERIWKRGRYHHGQILRVRDLLLVLGEDGEMSLVELTPDEPNKVLGSFQALDGKTWNNIALYGDLLVIRNGQEAAVYRLPLTDA